MKSTSIVLFVVLLAGCGKESSDWEPSPEKAEVKMDFCSSGTFNVGGRCVTSDELCTLTGGNLSGEHGECLCNDPDVFPPAGGVYVFLPAGGGCVSEQYGKDVCAASGGEWLDHDGAPFPYCYCTESGFSRNINTGRCEQEITSDPEATAELYGKVYSGDKLAVNRLITVKENGMETTTDLEGNYSINLPPGDYTLIIYFKPGEYPLDQVGIIIPLDVEIPVTINPGKNQLNIQF